MANLDQCIVDKCKLSWDEKFIAGTKNSQNCSGFVKAVATKLGVALPATANADDIVDAVAAGWTRLASGALAAQQAATGALVLAGLKAKDHTPARNNGHVAIVVSGALYRDTYPMVWCGSTGGAQSQGTKSVGEVWSQTDRKNVSYFAYGTLVCKQP